MEQQALLSLPAGKGHLAGGDSRMNRLHAGAESPADDFPVVQIKDRRQIYPLRRALRPFSRIKRAAFFRLTRFP
jgi:hypothetical protein